MTVMLAVHFSGTTLYLDYTLILFKKQKLQAPIILQ